MLVSLQSSFQTMRTTAIKPAWRVTANTSYLTPLIRADDIDFGLPSAGSRRVYLLSV